LILGYYFGSCGKISQPKLIAADKVKKRIGFRTKLKKLRSKVKAEPTVITAGDTMH
jgi:hypothetical protein